jgi:hypothetical protein
MAQPVDFEKLFREFEDLFKKLFCVDAAERPGPRAASKEQTPADTMMREIRKMFEAESPEPEKDKKENLNQTDVEREARDMAYKFWKSFFGGPYRSAGAESPETKSVTTDGVRIFLRREDEGHRILFMQDEEDAPIALGVIDAIECSKKDGIMDGVNRILGQIHVIKKLSAPFGIVR